MCLVLKESKFSIVAKIFSRILYKYPTVLGDFELLWTVCSLFFFNNLFNFIWQWSCHQQIWRDYNDCNIKSPTNSLKITKLQLWKSLKSKIFCSPLGKSYWLIDSKCLSKTLQHMWKWAIIPFFCVFKSKFSKCEMTWSYGD